MKKMHVVMLMLAVVMFLSPVVAQAGQIKTQTVTSGEDIDFSIAVAESPQALKVMCGGNSGDAVLAGIGVFFIILILAASASSSA